MKIAESGLPEIHLTLNPSPKGEGLNTLIIKYFMILKIKINRRSSALLGVFPLPGFASLTLLRRRGYAKAKSYAKAKGEGLKTLIIK